MRYARFIGESGIEPAPRVIMESGSYIANPRPDVLEAHGYKPLVSDPQPETGENEYLVPRYEDTQDAILRHWSVMQDEEPQGEGGGDE